LLALASSCSALPDGKCHNYKLLGHQGLALQAESRAGSREHGRAHVAKRCYGGVWPEPPDVRLAALSGAAARGAERCSPSPSHLAHSASRRPHVVRHRSCGRRCNCHRGVHRCCPRCRPSPVVRAQQQSPSSSACVVNAHIANGWRDCACRHITPAVSRMRLNKLSNTCCFGGVAHCHTVQKMG